MNERLKLLRKILKLKQEDFGKKIGVTQSALTLMENGKRTIRDVYINQICHEFNVNIEWLRFGTGEMFVQPDTFSLDTYAQQKKLTDLELNIIKGYMDLDVDVRQALLSFAKQVFAKSEEAATVELTPEQIAADEAEKYRIEVLAELKGATLSASGERKEESS